MEDRLRWYEAEVIMADLTGHRHTRRGTSEEQIEARMRQLYPKAPIILARPQGVSSSCQQGPSSEIEGTEASSRCNPNRRRSGGDLSGSKPFSCRPYIPEYS
jgi:hypothetical protein